jgi:hypothetical protein
MNVQDLIGKWMHGGARVAPGGEVNRLCFAPPLRHSWRWTKLCRDDVVRLCFKPPIGNCSLVD